MIAGKGLRRKRMTDPGKRKSNHSFVLADSERETQDLISRLFILCLLFDDIQISP